MLLKTDLLSPFPPSYRMRLSNPNQMPTSLPAGSGLQCSPAVGRYQPPLCFWHQMSRALRIYFFALTDRCTWQRVVDEKRLLILTVNQTNQAVA